MAAVLALVLIPAIAAVGFMVVTNEGGSLGTMMATLCFAMLAAGVFVGLFKMARRWEDETP